MFLTYDRRERELPNTGSAPGPAQPSESQGTPMTLPLARALWPMRDDRLCYHTGQVAGVPLVGLPPEDDRGGRRPSKAEIGPLLRAGQHDGFAPELNPTPLPPTFVPSQPDGGPHRFDPRPLRRHRQLEAELAPPPKMVGLPPADDWKRAPLDPRLRTRSIDVGFVPRAEPRGALYCRIDIFPSYDCSLVVQPSYDCTIIIAPGT